MLRPYRCVTLTIVATVRPFVNTFQVEIEERKRGEKSSFFNVFLTRQNLNTHLVSVKMITKAYQAIASHPFGLYTDAR